MVVDDVEDDFDARLMHGAHERLELLHLLAPVAGRRIGVVRREEADRVVAPVVGQALVVQTAVGDELVHGHQLDGGDAELGEVVDHHRVGEAGVGAADGLRDVGVLDRHALDVGLVDERLVVRDAELRGRCSSRSTG